MPIPLPPPPAPYVAPDLHPIAARGTAQLTFVRDAASGRIVSRDLRHDLWLAAEGAPLEVRYHRDADGTAWAEQAFYAAGDRRGGVASAAASALLARTDPSVSRGRLGQAQGFVRFTIRSRAGATLRTWRLPGCAESGAVRLDRPDSPELPTFPSTWEGCSSGGSNTPYVRGRIQALDRGWAARLPTTVATGVAKLKPGSYLLDVTVDPDEVLADANRANSSATVDLRVKVITRKPRNVALGVPDNCEVHLGGRIFCDGSDTGLTLADLERAESQRSRELLLGVRRLTRPRGAGPMLATSVRPLGRATHRHADGSSHEHRAVGDTRPEPQSFVSSLRVVEALLERTRASVEGGPRPRVGEAAPAAPEGVDLPNLVNAPSYGISVRSVVTGRKAGAKQRRDLLKFGALTWNEGPGRLEVEAFRETGTTLSAYQVFSADGVRSQRQARGTLIWHAARGHDHFHFQSFAHYTLTDLAGATVRDSGKNSWCIVDTDSVDTTRPGVPSSAAYSMQDTAGTCGSDPGSLWARLGLSVGSGDYYSQDVAGQAFDITNLRNGAYRIVLAANPDRLIAESSYDDNVSQRTVTLGGRPGARTVRVAPHPLIDPTAERQRAESGDEDEGKDDENSESG